MAKRQTMSKNKRIAACVAALAVAVGGVLCCGYASRTDEGWFKNPDLSSWHWADKTLNDDNGNLITSEGGSNGVQLAYAAIAVADFEAYGLDEEETETACTLTIMKTPENSVVTRFTWSAEFVNPSSTWANGKTVSDYLTVTPAEDNCSAVVACKQAFGEQIRVKVVYNDDTTIFATRMADYVKRVEGYAVRGLDSFLNNNDGGEVSLGLLSTFTYGVGSVQGNLKWATASACLELSQEAYDYLISSESSSHQYMSKFLAANNNDIGLKTKTAKQSYNDEGDWFSSCLPIDFLKSYFLNDNNNYYAAFREMLENTTNQIRLELTITYAYGERYTEALVLTTEWVTISPDNVELLSGININGSELVF